MLVILAIIGSLQNLLIFILGRYGNVANQLYINAFFVFLFFFLLFSFLRFRVKPFSLRFASILPVLSIQKLKFLYLAFFFIIVLFYLSQGASLLHSSSSFEFKTQVNSSLWCCYSRQVNLLFHFLV